MSNIVEQAKKRQKEDLRNAKDDIVYTSYLETPEYILEQVKMATTSSALTAPLETGFIKFNKNSGTQEPIEYYNYNNKVYKPIKDELTNNVWLPTGIEEYHTTDNLIDILRKLFKYNFQVPNNLEKFLPYFCLFTWVYEKFPFVPYINFVGLTATGKTTAMEVFGSTCYKAIDVSGSITISSIFRTTTAWRGTLLIDEFDNVGEEAKQMISFLKSGVANRAVLRVEGDKKREVRAYIVKCPKIFTSERPINDGGLQSRTIVISMEKNQRIVPLYRLDDFQEETQKIRNMLLLWRLRNLNKIDLRDIKFGFKELQTFDSRVQQVITPIYYLSNKETRKEIIDFAKEQEEETYRERRESIDGMIFEIIFNFYQLNQLMTLEKITDDFNKQSSFKPWSNQKVSNVIRKILKLELERIGKENIRTVIYDKEAFKKLIDYFNLSPNDVVKVVEEVVNNETKQIKLDQVDQTNTKGDTWTDPPIM